jgi:50S ribosomal protein L16 3-hydroxylase
VFFAIFIRLSKNFSYYTMRPAHSRPSFTDEALPLLGGLSAAAFMRRYWQKKPLLIRQAIEHVQPPLTREALFALAGREDVESRLIGQRRGRWFVEHGPFEDDGVPGTRARPWTLLVQGVNLHDQAADALLRRFDFLPNARLDDLMISYASDGGGVGPHYDSYDVFLLQVHGRRRWRIAQGGGLNLRDDVPLKILENFEAQQEWLLEPGDMLYLPPQVAHDGLAEGECMTCSIGFRAPLLGEIVGQFHYDRAERSGALPGAQRRYSDRARAPTAHPGEVPADLVATMVDWIARAKWSPDDVADFLGRYLTEPKPQVFFDTPSRMSDAARFLQRACRDGVALDLKSMFLYDSKRLYMNGETIEAPARARKILRRLADARALEGAEVVTLANDSHMAGLLHEWYCGGWIRLGPFYRR